MDKLTLKENLLLMMILNETKGVPDILVPMNIRKGLLYTSSEFYKSVDSLDKKGYIIYNKAKKGEKDELGIPGTVMYRLMGNSLEFTFN